ncbi:hypothetical protein [Xanthomarina sp. GH4-25]|uniref:hypothetical protein n=1 Tax=Xanthomarina sp. GH4-25 TaxID=3349335 RepID=UPI003877C8CC
MIKFIKNNILFSFYFASGLVLLISLTNLFIQKKADFKLKNNIKYVVFGNSHPECAFNDSLISNFKNLADSGESYFYTYQKAKQVLKQNPQIETVFIEYSTSNINKSEDEKIWNNTHLNFHFPRYSAFINLPDNLFLFSKNANTYLKTLPISLKYKLTRIITNNYEFINATGGYTSLDKEVSDSLIKTIKTPAKLLNSHLNNLSIINMEYLEKTIKLCTEYNKKVYLIRTPYHKKHFENAFEADYQKIKNIKFKNIPLLDFIDFNLKNQEFADLQHLNKKGANKFSLWFDSQLKNMSLFNIKK